MKLTPIFVIATLALSGAALAQTGTGSTRNPTTGRGDAMTTAPVSNPTPNAVAGPRNSTGNMNTKGAGRGTTGTGQKGGSGNE